MYVKKYTLSIVFLTSFTQLSVDYIYMYQKVLIYQALSSQKLPNSLGVYKQKLPVYYGVFTHITKPGASDEYCTTSKYCCKAR